MSDEIDKFIAALQRSLGDGTFVKLTLSNYKGPEPFLQRILVRPVALKKGRKLMFQYRYESRDVVKNFERDDAAAEARRWIGSGFRSGHLFTASQDLQLTVGKRNSRLITGKPTLSAPSEMSHDRSKHTFIDPSAAYLKALGITTDRGKIRADAHGKWKQINKFVEIVAGLIENSALRGRNELRIVDMGSGKGYLTFALYDLLVRAPRDERDGGTKSSRIISMTGVEQRPELVGLCNDLARSAEFDGLNFVRGTIADIDPGEVDILIALHACDTATDDALFKGVTAKAEIIVAAPCCHKEVRPQITPPEMLSGILKHGIMLERTAEAITDGLRALLLERSGYTTKLFEFIATEHTPKNNMLVATRNAIRSNTDKVDRQIREIKSLYGIDKQRLEELLKDVNLFT